MTKILCIHGIGGKDATMPQWSKDWQEAIKRVSGISGEPEFKFLAYDSLFENAKQRTDGVEYAEALRELVSSWLSRKDRKERIFGIRKTIDAYAGMVAQFAVDKQLAKEVHQLLEETFESFKPDVVFTHSLGSLITYDYLRSESVKGQVFPFVYVTCGSQIRHPALAKRFGGRIETVNVDYWINFHNAYDYAFAYVPIDIQAANFNEIDTTFDEPWSIINHDALRYIEHENAANIGWPAIVSRLEPVSRRVAKLKTAVRASSPFQAKAGRKANQKALLVGINDYPTPEDRLEGCINDVFRMSEVLQELGFRPDDIRVVLNQRATAAGMKDRMKWLLDDCKPGDTRFFFFSGHGTKIPASADSYETDGNLETLVPYDFDWTPEHAFTDKEFVKMYSQLDYGVQFVAMLDCCHSGGMSRDGARKARGINPPDDIRHREIKWDPTRQMWVEREIPLAKQKLFNSRTKNKEQYTGSDRSTYKLGRAIPLWTSEKEFKSNLAQYGHHGPYVPTILQACREDEYSYEYRHGVTSFGAFTYSITTIMRQLRGRQRSISFHDLMQRTVRQLRELRYDQTPQLFPESRGQNMTPFV